MKKFHFNINKCESEEAREIALEMEVAERIKHANANPDERLSIQEVLTEEEYMEFLAMDADAISDEELFECSSIPDVTDVDKQTYRLILDRKNKK